MQTPSERCESVRYLSADGRRPDAPHLHLPPHWLLLHTVGTVTDPIAGSDLLSFAKPLGVSAVRREHPTPVHRETGLLQRTGLSWRTEASLDMQFNAILIQAPDVVTGVAAGLSQGQALAEMRLSTRSPRKKPASRWISRRAEHPVRARRVSAGETRSQAEGSMCQRRG